MAWSLNELRTLLESQSDLKVAMEEEAILLSNPEGIDAFVTVSGAQILVESLLFPANRVKDPAAFNNAALSAHKDLFPLTSIGITAIAGEPFYVAFGALSAESKAETVLIEVESLFLNVEGMIEFFEGFLAEGDTP